MNKEPELTKEYILGRLDSMIVSYESAAHVGNQFAQRDLRTLKAIRFVLKNRTVDNWGPKVMSFGEAIGESMKYDV